MNIFIYGNDQTFRINEAFSLRFDGVTLSTHRNGEFVSSIPAQKGDSFYVIAQGMIKQPQITKAELPESYGERIAWALSFIGENKIAKSEEDFYKKLIEIRKDDSFSNITIIAKSRRYTICTADKHVNKDNAKNALKVKKASPTLAWISDDLTPRELDELLETFQTVRKIFCPIEYIKSL